MTREIKFNCIVKGNNDEIISSFNEWLDGDGWKHDYYAPLVTSGVFSHEELGDGFLGEIIRRRFTGRKDKNGKDIYEGNIVKYSVFANWNGDIDRRATGFISFNDAAFVILRKKYPFHSSFYPIKEAIMLNETNATWGLEIIGNIYENPDLLK